jgi:uncharacterized damage-inducible protein DinB
VLGVEVSPSTTTGYARLAFGRMLAVADRLGDELVNQRPIAPHVNSVASLVIHCCGVAEYWLGHEGLGRESTRDRDAEFRTIATVDELREMVAARIAQVEADVADLDRLGLAPGPTRRDELPGGATPASIVVHVVEEVFQHTGHMDIAADVLLARA